MPARDLPINDWITIPAEDLELQFSRASGAGGQNVNKVNSRAELRFFFSRSQALPPAVAERLRQRVRSRLTSDGDLIIASQRHRDQARNIEDCYSRLRDLVAAAVPPPVPRFETRPTQGSRQRRLSDKKRRSETKRSRGSGDD